MLLYICHGLCKNIYVDTAINQLLYIGKFLLKTFFSWVNSVTPIMDGKVSPWKYFKFIMRKTLRAARIWQKYWSKISIILWCQIVFIFYHFSCFVFKFATLWTEKVTTLHSKIKRKHVGPMQIWFYFSKAIYYSINHQRQTFLHSNKTFELET